MNFLEPVTSTLHNYLLSTISFEIEKCFDPSNSTMIFRISSESLFFFSKFQSEQVCRLQTTMEWELRKNRKHDIREMEKQKSSVWREKCCDLDEFCNLELLHAFSPSLLTVVAAVERSELE